MMSNWSFVNALVTLDFFGTASIACSIVLPVELTSFEALQHNQQVDLIWETQSETNNDFFLIEHSIDGAEWIEIGRVSGHGTTTSPLHYSAVDKSPHPGINYYRLRQFDFNGMSKVSPIQSVYFEPQPALHCIPNPASENIRIEFITTDDLGVVEIVDMSGRPVFQKERSSFPLQLELSEWPAGTYFIQCTSARFSARSSFVVIH